MIVVDASAALPWFLPDEMSSLADRAAGYVAVYGATVPGLWHLEVRNVLLMCIRRRRLSEAAVYEVLRLVPSLGIVVDPGLDPDAAFRLALSRQISVYDATYLELARRRGLPLATLDAKLARAAQSEGVALFA